MDDRTAITVPETTAQTPMGLGVLPERHRFAISPLNRRRWQSFKANRRGYVAFWIFMVLFVISLFAEFIANDKPFYVRFDGKSFFPVVGDLSGDRIRRRFRDRGRLPRSVPAEAHRREGWLYAVAADPLFVQYPQSRFADAGAVEADLDADRGAMQVGGRAQGPDRLQRPRIQLARHRRPGPRRGGAPDLRLSPLGAVRAGA